MRVSLTLLITALAFMLSSPARSADASPKGAAEVLQKLAPFVAEYNQFLLGGGTKDCTNPPVVLRLPTCVVDVDVWLVNSRGTDYCLTQFPREIKFDRLTRVVWKLKDHVLTSAPTTKTYHISFHDSYGILPQRDRYGQVLGGGIGDGSTPNKWWYRRINLYTNADPAIVYVPLILQTLSTDPNDVGVCAAGDPRMVNN